MSEKKSYLSALYLFHQRALKKYIISFLIVALTVVIQKLLWPWINPAPFLLFYPAVILASFTGDGTSSIIFSALASQYFFIPPENSLQIKDPGDVLRLLVFVSSALVISKIIKMEIHGKLKAQAAVELLRKRENELELEKDTRDKFVATLTHDLQTPITSLKLNLQLVDRMKDLSETGKKKIKNALQSLDRIQNMVQDLLVVNSIRAGKRIPLEISECQLNALADSTVEDLKQIYGDRFKVLHNENLSGHWSCHGVRRILENLCTNAIKYGEEDKPVKIIIEKGDDFALLSVKNEGPPIPPEAQKVLFEPWERLEQTAGTKRGWGLGLTLVKGLTEAHGGSVKVESSEKTGTIFSVYLPLNPQAAGTSSV